MVLVEEDNIIEKRLVRVLLISLTFISLTTALVFSLLATGVFNDDSKTSSFFPLISSGGLSSANVFVDNKNQAVSPSQNSEIIIKDARPIILKNYLASYYSPLEPFSDDILSTADKYGLDYKLIIAIARNESNLCKNIPEGSFNCWGWGIYSNKITKYESFLDSLEAFSKGIKEEYIDKGFSNVGDIAYKFNPKSPEAWSKSISTYMGQLE